METEQLIKDILKLKKEKNAVILCHNYQPKEHYEVADYIGDSLELARAAAKTDADIILFAGVDFMAESAKILSPNKKVLLPVKDATCPMAAMADTESIKKLKQEHPNAVVVAYVNTTADVKAESDISCTSANAVKVVNSLEENEIICTPDINLGRYIQKNTDKKIILWKGHCYVHSTITPEFVKEAKKAHPDALILAHPECIPEVLDMADHIASTSGMIRFAKTTEAKEMIILTEEGMVNALKRECPDKIFYSSGKVCIDMKKINLENIKNALENEVHEIQIPEDIRLRAEKSVRRMMDLK